MYDDRFTLVLNGSDTPITIDDILLDEIEEGLEGDLTSCEGCSSLVADAPPIPHLLICKGCGIFLLSQSFRGFRPGIYASLPSEKISKESGEFTHGLHTGKAGAEAPAFILLRCVHGTGPARPCR